MGPFGQYIALPIVLFVSGTWAKLCRSYTIPITITSANLVYGLPPLQDNFDVARLVDTITSRTPPTTPPFSGSTNVTANYTIAATFCSPGRGEVDPHKSTVIIATHGLNFDGSYWDPKLGTSYSFVDWAISQGYSVFYYDRLGVGDSTRVSGYVAQLSNQVAVLAELTRLVKSGQYTGKYSQTKVVYMGHSFGSAISYTALANDVSLADAIVLTGFSLNTTYANPLGFLQASQPRIAASQHPAKWQQLDTGYLVPADLYSNVNTFFNGNYDKSVAEYAEAHKQPFALSELLTITSIPSLRFPSIGPAMIISGKLDFIYCTSNCDDVLKTPGAEVFAYAKAFKAVSYPDAGHGLNLHANANGVFQQITDFLSEQGL
ncbi:hypothetical protein N5P37_011737 [Trichoderma harzianum]|uniref:AB hydrolase-1 domain-containing protein n=1 Tax=Trichoderma harzianum CBS 226.95 TaxID=983964 RepID=A0A2T3ZRX3_TRIHA|nr:hypothetical protein M431DRAFT_102057 [Trichoderma harzianum CBS 226.95]KAK0755705.1 hypothetical protein N5P37_011737 [Trichoderma harzianum]PKK47972.1 hypothetical protein CI102_8192 [Trichoderma harzianum]PTB47557.1 hypothetical protein M431DRAFT_102057 [Trichoderma harzianum CBS 226.95]